MTKNQRLKGKVLKAYKEGHFTANEAVTLLESMFFGEAIDEELENRDQDSGAGQHFPPWRYAEPDDDYDEPMGMVQFLPFKSGIN